VSFDTKHLIPTSDFAASRVRLLRATDERTLQLSEAIRNFGYSGRIVRNGRCWCVDALSGVPVGNGVLRERWAAAHECLSGRPHCDTVTKSRGDLINVSTAKVPQGALKGRALDDTTVRADVDEERCWDRRTTLPMQH
jgi:hypothetical protein